MRKNVLLIERLCETFNFLYQGNIIDKNWLCEKFGINERTAYRDLARLSHLLDEVSTARYKLNQTLLPALHVRELAEFASFSGVSHLFPKNEGIALRKQMQKAKNINIQGASSRKNYQFNDLIDSLDHAISVKKTINFTYRNKLRSVQPYRLINRYGLWYLAGVDNEILKAFELASISHFSVSNLIFIANDAIVNELNHTSGIHFGSGIEVTLWVSAHAAPFVTRRPLFPQQRILQTHTDDSLTLITTIRDKHTLFRWLRYWLPDIHIQKPASLKTDFDEDFRLRIATANATSSIDS